MRVLAVLAAISIAAPTALVAAGCGGEKKTEAEVEREGGGEAARDRVAYYQLTTTSGLVRAHLLEIQHRVARPATLPPGELERALRRVAKLRPRDGGLRAARRDLTAVGRQSLDAGAAQVRTLRRSLDRINADLSRFLRRHPAQGALVPD